MLTRKHQIPVEVGNRWLNRPIDRFVRFDGCEVSCDKISGERRWIAMVPEFSNKRRTCWTALKIDGTVGYFHNYSDAIRAVEVYLDLNEK